MTQTKLFTEQERLEMVRLRRRIARYEQTMSETQNSNLAKWIEPDKKELNQLYSTIGERALKMRCDGLLIEVTR